MKLFVYSVYDSAVQIYCTPFTAINDADAQRSFVRLCVDTNSTVFQSPRDFTLMRVGVWDDAEASIISYPPVRVMQASRMQLSNDTVEEFEGEAANG